MARKKVPEWLRTPRICSLCLERLDIEREGVNVHQAVKKAAECHANAFRISSVDGRGMGYYRSRNVPPAPGLGMQDFVREAQDACRDNDLRLLVTVDASGISSSHPLFPEGACKTPDAGTVEIGHPPVHRTCLIGPYRELLLRSIGEIFSQFRPDGCVLLGARVPRCLCASCVSKFSHETEMDIPVSILETEDERVGGYFRWLQKETQGLREEVEHQIESYSSEAYTFFDDFPETQVTERASDGLWVSDEEEWAGSRPLWAVGELSGYSMAFPGPVLNEVSYCVGGARLPESAARPGTEIKVAMAQVLAGGSYPELANFPLRDFRSLPAVAEMFGLVKRAAGAFDSRACEPAHFLLLPQERAFGRTTVERVRLEEASQGVSGDKPSAGRHGPDRNSSAMYLALLRAGIPVNIGRSGKFLRQLAGQAVLCLANERSMNDRTVQAVQSFVKAGGGLIATYETSLYDENGRKRGNFGLADVFGVDYVETCPRPGYLPGVPILLTGQEPHPVTGPLPLGVALPNDEAYVACRDHGSTAVLAAFQDVHEPSSDEADGDAGKRARKPPAIVVNTYGQGKVVYFPWQPEVVYAKRGYRDVRLLIREAAYWVSQGKTPVEVNSSGTVAVSLFEQKHRSIVHLVNLSADLSQEVDQVFPLIDASVVLNFRETRKVTSRRGIVSGLHIREMVSAEKVEISLPELREYEVLMVEFE